MFRAKIDKGYSMSRLLTFENHDAYLMYSYATEREPDLKVYGEISVKYAIYLYYKAFLNEESKRYKHIK